ncbi:MAG: diguanylate cyclase [Agathobaculum butyriciproducens]
MKKRSSIALLTALLAIVFAAGIGVYSNYIGMQIYEESSNHLLESYAQISKTFTLFVQRNWVVLSQWDSLMKNAQEDADIDSIWSDAQNNKLLWHYSDFYLFNESTQYLTVDGRKGSADSINGVFQEMYSKGEPIVSTYTATYGVPKIAFAMPMSRNLTLDGVTYTGIAVSYDTDVVDDLVDGSMYGGQSDCYVVRSNGDIVLELEPQTELCEGMTNLYDLSDHVDWKYGSMDDIRDCIQLGKSGSVQFTCDGVRNYLVAIPTAFSDWSLVGIIQADEVDGALYDVQNSSLILLGALSFFAVIIVVLALGMESRLRLKNEEMERLNLEREKMKSDRFLQSMSRIVDRYMVVNLDTGRYRYHELRSSEPLYPTSGQYSEMVEIISKRYVALTETENAKLSRLLEPDYLTGLFNERYFSRVLNICEAKKLPFVLYYLDLDRFKPVNDTYGHAMGDRLLKEISARLLRCIRSRDYAFRIGGDEFALIVSADMDEEQRSRMAERIQTMLSAPIVIEGKVLSVGVSCGCACYPEDGDASQVRITADSRMYAEKQHHHADDRTEEQS